MSSDKLQAVHEALANVFNQSNLNATGTAASQAAFDHETLSEAFSESHPKAANTEHSFARFDYEALTGIFSETPTDRPSPTSFDPEFSDTLSERSPLSSNTNPPRRGFDDQAFADLLSEAPPVSANKRPPQPSFDHQALAEMLTELSADPISPHMSSPGYDTDPSSAPVPRQIDQEEPKAKAIAVAPPTSEESARQPPRARSLLARLHHLFSTKEETPVSDVDNEPLPPSRSDLPHTPEPMALDSSTTEQEELSRPADAPRAELPSVSFEQEQKSPHLVGQPAEAKPVASVVAIAHPADTASAWPLQATSLPSEISAPISIDREPSPPTLEKDSSTPTVTGRLGNVDQDIQAVAVSAPAEAENARPQATSLLVEPVSPTLSIIEPPDPVFGKGGGPILPNWLDLEKVTHAEKLDLEQVQRPLTELTSPISSIAASPILSQLVLSGQRANLAPREKIAASADIESVRSQLARSPLAEPPPRVSIDTEPSSQTPSQVVEHTASAASTAHSALTHPGSTQPQRLRLLLAEIAPIISDNSKPPLAISEEGPSRPTSSTQLENLESAANGTSVPLTNSESAAMQPRQPQLLQSDVVSPDTTSTKPQPFISKMHSSPTIESRQPKHAVPAVEPFAAATLPDAEAARPLQDPLLLADLPPSRSSLGRKASPAIFTGEFDKIEPEIETTAATAQAHSVEAQQRTSLPLTGLPALVSADTKSSFPNFEQDLPPRSLSGPSDSVVPSVTSVLVAHPTGAEDDLPQHASSLLTALRVLNEKPSLPLLSKEPSLSKLASWPGNPLIPVETTAHPTDAESGLSQQTKLLHTEMPALVSTDAKPSAPIHEKEPPSHGSSSYQPTDVALTARAVAVAPPTDRESAVTRAEQAKSLLAELDLNTAIHLRWVMRDIRSKRTKFSPVSASDLTMLVELGLVEMREELPRLTGFGVLALD